MSAKPQKIKAIRDFFNDKHLKSLDLTFTDDVILAMIDVQWNSFEMWKTPETEEKFPNIEKAVPEYRKLMQVYNFFILSPEYRNQLDSYNYRFAKPYDKYKVEPEDINILKVRRSILPRFNARAEKKHKDAKLVFVGGVNLNACVIGSVRDLRRAGYEVCVLTDLVANDRSCRWYDNWTTKEEKKDWNHRRTHPSKAWQRMSRLGVFLERSEDVLEHIQQKRASLSL